MAKIYYQLTKFRESALHTIAKANLILEEYAESGYDLTLRQLYYQFVARGFIANNMREYKNLGSIVNDARLCGLIDWDHIVDRTRNVRSNPHWDSPGDIIETCAKQFRFDRWEDQDFRVEVWIEKDALIGVVERVCTRLDIPYFSCRGYVSQSEIHEAAIDRFVPWHEQQNQQVVIIHLGDHDPSGIDMTRDIEDRLNMFGANVDMRRIALNMDQVQKYNPPPNPAKITDSRATKYIDKYGDESWELDALSPDVLDRLITAEVDSIVDAEKYEAAIEREKEARKGLLAASNRWDDIVAFVAKDQVEKKPRPKRKK